MDDVYEYARAQMIGLQFAPFRYRAGLVYTWHASPWLSAALAWLDARWPAASFRVFCALVEVTWPS